MPKKLKVLFLSSWFPNRVLPANGDFVERHALAVSEICETAVIYVFSDSSVKNGIFEITEKTNNRLYEIIIYFKKNECKLKFWSKFINGLRYLRGYVIGFRLLGKRFGRPQIIHANIIYPISIIALLYSFLYRIPYIITEHWTLYLHENTKNLPGYFITKIAARKAYAITPVTENLAKALQKHGYKGNYIVIPNVVDVDVFCPAKQEKEIHNKLRFIHVSSMKEEQKNITAIIKTLKRLAEIRTDFTFTFVGELNEYQKELMNELNFPEGMIILKGETSHNEVAEIMREHEIMVMFSNYENLPCVILEALACGLPVISSDVGGINEWINENTGLLIEPNNEDQLLNGLIYMMNNYGKYNKDYLHAYAGKYFSKQAIAEAFHELYKKAVK